MRSSLVTKLVVAFLAPTLALVILAPWVGYRVAREGFEAEVAKRLVASASAAAASLRAELLVTLQPGDEGNRTHRNLLARLEPLQPASKVERLYAFDRDRRLLVSTGEALPIGSPLPELERDRLELARVFRGEPLASALAFEGRDGRTFLSAYAPVVDDQGRVVAAVGADASADFFAVLHRFGFSMAGLGLLLGVFGFGLFLAVGHRWLLKPIRDLLAAARRIGGGDLTSPVRGSGADELGALAEGMDRMRERLLERERELQLMLAGIAHEVRNPLGGIALFAGLLAEELATEPEKLEHVRKVQRELGYLERVVDEFLSYAREPRLALEPLVAGALLEELRELGRAELERRGQRVDVVAEAISFEADAGALRRALLNLLRNASEAAPEGGHIRLEARRQDGRVRFAVSDDGPGVTPEQRRRLFAPFQTTKEKGLGLGLALVRRIAEAHGGTARYEEGKGATFVLELPEKKGSGRC